MSILEVKVPDIGDYRDVPITEVLVKPGDRVAAEDSLITLESDKATLDIPAPAAGVVSEIKVKVGDKVSQGTLVLTLEAGAEQAAAAAPAPAPAAAAPVAPAAAPPAATKSSPPQPAAPRAAPLPAAALEPIPAARTGLAHASPSVRRFARDLGVDL
ncbi:MAG: biotin/lipoyl-containing protein, partial [Pseudomonadota bacterium]